MYLLPACLKIQSKINKSLQQKIHIVQLNMFARRSLLALLQPSDESGMSPPLLTLGLVQIKRDRNDRVRPFVLMLTISARPSGNQQIYAESCAKPSIYTVQIIAFDMYVQCSDYMHAA